MTATTTAVEHNVIIVGVGGQGIILASEILAEAALLAGYDVRKSEVHGMAQRGGSVSSHVRFGSQVLSPLIERGRADYMLAFEKAECLRALDFLAPGASVVLNDLEIIPTTVSTGVGTYPQSVDEAVRSLGFPVVMVDADSLAEQAGTIKASNVVLLGALAARFTIPEAIWLAVIERRVPKRFLDVNRAAFRLGYGFVPSTR